jgi:uncharacterized protein (DUF1778 family)
MNKTEAELAEHYNETSDVSDFEGTAEPVEVRRDVTISVRFSEDEIAALRERADIAGTRVTAFIRAAALEAEHPVDRAAVARLATAVEQQAHQLRKAVG